MTRTLSLRLDRFLFAGLLIAGACEFSPKRAPAAAPPPVPPTVSQPARAEVVPPEAPAAAPAQRTWLGADTTPAPPGRAKLVSSQFGSCVAMASGAPVCWGGSAVGRPRRPGRVFGFEGEARTLAMGTSHACAVVADGRVLCWGANASGQLGTSAPQARNARPVAVPNISDAVSVVAGKTSTCVLRRPGTVTCFGGNTLGQLGGATTDPQAGPVNVRGLNDAAQIAMGSERVCALRRTGEVVCWGGTHNRRPDEATLEITPVEGLVAPDGIIGGVGNTFCGWGAHGVECWADNRSALLGGRVPTGWIPEARGVTGSPVRGVGIGSVACAITPAAELVCWGSNHDGGAIPGGEPRLRTPTPVPGLTNVLEVSGSGTNMCVRRSDGSVWCWGRDLNGSLGHSVEDPEMGRPYPVELPD